jgi:hypothetical protein
VSFFIPIKYISTAQSAGFSSPIALWRQQLHSDRIDILTYGLPVDDSRLGLQVSLQRLNNKSVVCPPHFLGQDARSRLVSITATVAAFLLSYRPGFMAIEHQIRRLSLTASPSEWSQAMPG